MNTHNSNGNWQVLKIFLQVAPVIFCATLCIAEANAMSDFPTSRLSLWATGLVLIVAAGLWSTRSIKKLLNDRTSEITHQYQQSASATQGVQMGFLQTISDDVRGPLMSIVTNLRSMSETARGKEGEELNGLYKQGIRLQGRLNSALELGRVNLKRSGQSRPIDLSQLASDLAENYAQALLNKPNLLLNILVDHRLPQAVEAEPHRLMLLLGNLLENAVGYSEQGQINLKIAALTPKVTTGDEIEIEISCSDCGLGIPQERLQRLMLELENAPVSGTLSEAGLGLRAAMNIARYYKGTLTVTSKEGTGTTVTATIKLPVLAEAREWKQLPKSFRFSSSTQDTYIALGNAGFFHGISMVPVQDPTALSDDNETILIDGSDLILKTWGSLDQFKPRERYVIMLHKDQNRLREQFLSEGFSRFLSWPLVSTMLLKYLTDEDTPITARKHAVRSTDVSSINILVVDDAETNRLRICYHLRSSGFQVTEATDGLEVVGMIKAGSTYDLILTDLNMTHLNGDEALKQIRAIESTKGIHTPIVAISAYVDADAEKNLKNAGFDAVLRKPVYLDELDFLVSSMIPEKKAPIKQTKLIDLEELKQRSNGKIKLMAILLDSFIQSSQTQLQDLKLGGSGTADKATYLKTIHTLKGLLLEAGAKESAGYLNHVEKQARYTGQISIDEIEQITQVINNVSEEAAALRAGLEQPQQTQ